MVDMAYATVEFYMDKYLLGRRPKFPISEFPFWEKRARMYIDQFTFDRLHKHPELLATYADKIGECACELAEFCYLNEGSENKTSESISGHSASYTQGYEYVICQKNLGMTGLTYRGSIFNAAT